MAQLIIHHGGAYNLYSTIVDGPIFETALTLEQLTDHIRAERGAEGINELPRSLERAHKTGCSGLSGQSFQDCISRNRAGVDGARLSDDEFVNQYLTITKNKA